MNFKRKSIITLLIMFALLLLGVTNVEVKANTNGQLRVNDKYLYDATGTETIETTTGASYDIDTSTLTLNGYNGKGIAVYGITNFKIKIIGDNTISYDAQNESFAIYSVMGVLEIIGDGTLNIVDTNPYNTNEWASIKNLDSIIVIDGPTINIANSGNSGILSGAPIEIKNSKINISTTGDYGIYATSGNNGKIHISNSEINCTASKYAIAGSNISIAGKSTVTAKTTLDDASAITLYAKQGDISFTTDEKVVLEKAHKGVLSSPEPKDKYDSLESTYTYDIVEETNKVSYTLKNKVTKTLIDLIEIDGTSFMPVKGESPKDLNISSEKFEIINYGWYDENGMPFGKFEEGKTYELSLSLMPKNNYYFNNSTKAEISHMDNTYVWYYDDDPTSYTYGRIEIIATKSIPKVYKFVNGQNQTYTIGKDEKAVFEVDGDKSKVTLILIDGQNASSNDYTITGDNTKTIITLNKELLDSLSGEKHTLKVTYSDTQSVEAEFTITKQQADGNVGENGAGAASGEVATGSQPESEPVNSPKTGDNILLFIGILVISVVGISITTKLRKKQ